ncbi:DNA polymerase III subunit delta [Chromatiaceae bacterium AAb-1]|nr:DNA polymerase III subunit delta [Chromatiaceae bacterium AAb-1]
MQKIYASQLGQHLARELAPCYLIFGEEPLQKLEALEAIREAAKARGFSERLSFTADAQFNWDELFSEVSAMSLFSSLRILELELPQKLPASAGDKLKALSGQLHSDILLIVYGDRSHSDVSKLSWFKQLQQQAVQIPVYTLDERQFIQWLQQRARQYSLQLSSDALSLLHQHCAGNLLAARQELEKLVLTHSGQQLDANVLSEFLADHSSFTIFQLTDALLSGQGDEALHRLERLYQQDTEIVIIAWQLQKEVQQLQLLHEGQRQGKTLNDLFKQLAIWPKRQPLYQQALQRISARWLNYLLLELAAFDQGYKSGLLSDPKTALAHLICLFIRPVPVQFSLQKLIHD